MPAAIRERMTGAVLAEARGADLAGRVLFRSALLEAAAADPAGLPLGPEAARAALDVQTLPGSFLSAADRYARPAGDALATARTLRALTAPYRVAP